MTEPGRGAVVTAIKAALAGAAIALAAAAPAAAAPSVPQLAYDINPGPSSSYPGEMAGWAANLGWPRARTSR